ncbi:STAS domain-containing protein [Candidatus Pacearchaeota archaeon]|nr:STAS domain-containing protein [Candidatus Pacearchaeota archaeon]
MSELTVALSDASAPGIKVVSLTGEMDESSLEGLKAQLDPLLNDLNIKVLLFDFTQLEFINSKGIGYLVSIHTHLSKDQREMKIASANEAVMDVITLVGLTTIIKYFNTVEEALQV